MQACRKLTVKRDTEVAEFESVFTVNAAILPV
jgi:hypothetical protein